VHLQIVGISRGNKLKRLFVDVTFDKDLELLVFDISSLKILLEREKENKKKLVVLIKTSACVAKHLEGQVLNYVVQSLCSKRSLL